MKLSIVVPCYNCSRNILNLLNRLYDQIDNEVEVILINDGSTDNTLEIIENFIGVSNINNFNVYSFSNSGAAKAREIGLEKAIGDYVFFHDSDDLVDYSFYSKIMESISSCPDLIYFSSIVLSSFDDSVVLGKKVFFDTNELSTNNDLFFQNMIINKNWTSSAWTYVFRRELAIVAKAHFTNRTAHEDHLFTLRLVGNAKTISIVKDVLYYQKHTEGSLTTSKKNAKYIIERFKAFEESRDDMRNYFSEESIKLYESWSIVSFLYLVKANTMITWKWCFYPQTYFYILKYNRVFRSLINKYLTNKI